MIKRSAARFALILSFAGSIALFFSFESNSSRVQIVDRGAGTAAICSGNELILMVDNRGNTSVGTRAPCPEGARSIALVKVDHPMLVKAGWLLLVASTVIGFFSV